jgi:hypothetical protein
MSHDRSLKAGWQSGPLTESGTIGDELKALPVRPWLAPAATRHRIALALMLIAFLDNYQILKTCSP